MGLMTLFRSKPRSYWHKRSGFVYLRLVRELAQERACGATSIIDIGSNGCPVLEWFPTAPDRVSIDLENPYQAPGVRSIVSDFLTYDPGRRFDLCLCLQVLEHVPDAGSFARKLLTTATHVIASVPYKWPAGSCSQHVHDPVDEEKMRVWFGRAPNYSIVAQEKHRGPKSRRLICYYAD